MWKRISVVVTVPLMACLPGAYFSGNDNSDGTYTCEVNPGAAEGM